MVSVIQFWECLFKRERVKSQSVEAYIQKVLFRLGFILYRNASFFQELYLFFYGSSLFHTHIL